LQINVRVTTMDAELEFAIQPTTTGKQLFDQVGLSRRCTEELALAVLQPFVGGARNASFGTPTLTSACLLRSVRVIIVGFLLLRFVGGENDRIARDMVFWTAVRRQQGSNNLVEAE
jgi:hypothetical protein